MSKWKFEEILAGNLSPGDRFRLVPEANHAHYSPFTVIHVFEVHVLVEVRDRFIQKDVTTFPLDKSVWRRMKR